MKYFDETMKQIQKATVKLGHVPIDHTDPWHSLDQMKQVFDQNFWQNVHQLTSLAQNQRTSEPAQGEPPSHGARDEAKSFSPKIDLFETLSKVIVCCELAGLDKNSLKLSVSNGQLLILQGKIKEHDLSEFLVQSERYSGRFNRQVPLPSPVLSQGVKTSYKDGLLQVQLSKKENKQKEKGTNHVQVDI